MSPRLGWALVLIGLVLSAPVSGGPAVDVPKRAFAAERLEQISRRYIGVPYRLDPLGEGSGPDADPTFTRDCVDCQTLVEQVMAEAIAPWVGGLERAGRIVRYRNERVGLENRLHYCIPDWLDNPWPARDVTREAGGKSVRTIRRRIDLAGLLSGRGLTTSIPARVIETGYIPREAVSGRLSKLPHGSIALFVLDRDDLVVGHMGLLFRQGKHLILRHASQRSKRVIDEPLSDYLGRAPARFIGLKVLQPDSAGLGREANFSGARRD